MALPADRTAWGWSQPTRARSCSPSAWIARNARCASERCALRCCATGEEADYEGLCWDGGWFYATGSHARGRKKPDHQPSRHHVYRVRLEPGGIAGGRDLARAGALLGADPILAAHYHKQLDQDERGHRRRGHRRVRAGALLLGLRSPCLDGQAFLLEVALADLFEHDPDRTPQLQRHALALGSSRRHPRSRRWCRTACWCLAGRPWTATRRRSPCGIGAATGLRPLARFADLGDAKAEGLMVLAASDDRFEVLVVFDGVKQGRPHEYRLPRPRVIRCAAASERLGCGPMTVR